jgi:hypothetical protein
MQRAESHGAKLLSARTQQERSRNQRLGDEAGPAAHGRDRDHRSLDTSGQSRGRHQGQQRRDERQPNAPVLALAVCRTLPVTRHGAQRSPRAALDANAGPESLSVADHCWNEQPTLLRLGSQIDDDVLQGR